MQKQLGITGADPTATAGKAAANGTATTFMRSDGAPAIDQSLIVNIIPGGRLTLTTGVPVTTADVTAAGTLYYTPFAHDKIPLYNGTTWELITFAELSISLSGYTSGKLYDVFVYNNSGTAALETTIWTNSTTRATALAYQDGRLCKSGALTRLYLGTIYMSATSQTQDAAAGRYLVNAYNLVQTAAQLNETADISLSSTGWNDATATLTVLTFGGESLMALVGLSKGTTATQDHWTRMDIDGTTQIYAAPTTANLTSGYPNTPLFVGVLAPGAHTVKIQWSRVTASGTATNRPTSESTVNWRRIAVWELVR